MRVLFVFILPSGGVDTLNRMRVRALAQRGIDSHLLYFQRGSGVQNNDGFTVFYTGDPGQIGHIVRSGEYAAIVVVSFFMQLGLFREIGYTGPIIFEIQGFGPQAAARGTLLGARPVLDEYADAFLYPQTPHIGDILREGYPHKPRFAFNNPFDADAFRYRFVTKYDKTILAWIGRLDPNKNWRDFLTIAAKAAPSVPKMEIWMFSDPDLAEPGELEKMLTLTDTLGLAGRVHHVYNVPHGRMADFYSVIGDSGGILCMTSQAEGAPYAALEALSCRCPVVTTDSDGVRSSLVDGLTALYFDHGDTDAGAAQVVRLVRDSALRAKLAANGEARVRSRFTLAQYADNFALMLRQLGANPC